MSTGETRRDVGPVQAMSGLAPLPRSTPDMARRAAEAAARERDIAAKQHWNEVLPSIGVRYQACTIETFVATTDAQRRVKAVMADFVRDVAANVELGTNLVLFGTVGTGKDHLLVAALREAIKAGASAKYVSGMDLWAQMRGAFADDKNESTILRDYQRCDVLAISDPIPPFGTLTEFQTQVLYRLIDARYRACKSTWMTINLADGEQATAKLGAANVDRLKDHAVMVRFDWESHRKPAGRQS